MARSAQIRDRRDRHAVPALSLCRTPNSQTLSGTDRHALRLPVSVGLPDSPVDMGEEFTAQRPVRLPVSIRQTDNIHNKTASSELYTDAESCSSAVSAVSRAGVAWRQRVPRETSEISWETITTPPAAIVNPQTLLEVCRPAPLPETDLPETSRR